MHASRTVSLDHSPHSFSTCLSSLGPYIFFQLATLLGFVAPDPVLALLAVFNNPRVPLNLLEGQSLLGVDHE